MSIEVVEGGKITIEGTLKSGCESEPIAEKVWSLVTQQDTVKLTLSGLWVKISITLADIPVVSSEEFQLESAGNRARADNIHRSIISLLSPSLIFSTEVVS